MLNFFSKFVLKSLLGLTNSGYLLCKSVGHRPAIGRGEQKEQCTTVIYNATKY